MNSLAAYWPSKINVEACVRTEAETVDDAVLLAVHEPGPILARSASGSKEELRSEADLLNALMRSADDGSAVVVAITGASGVGKSHMVRWLHAQLQRHPKREKMVIVLVPKTASLRQVVGLILQPLGGAQYDALRSDLERAIDSVSPEQASHLLAAALAIELDNRRKEWTEELRAGGNLADSVAQGRIHHAQGLRDILRDGVVVERWLGKILLRIVKETLEGGSDDQTGSLRRFTPADLEVPSDWHVAETALVSQRYLAYLTGDSGTRSELAATVLQEVLDPALRMIFRFSESLGQRTIEEIVGDIRTQLFTEGEGRELVLLIEDFAALAGIQQPLLNLMIAESDSGGLRLRAPIRTALAVTDGFLPTRQTILTRAKEEWIIPSQGSSEAITIQRLQDLAGRYLNAARWGVEPLREAFAKGTTQTGELNNWVVPFQSDLDAHSADQLGAFGSSRHGFPLFPLSPMAIESMCRRSMMVAGEVPFNPRAFINLVMRKTLLERDQFLADAFPPPGIFNDNLFPDAEIALDNQHHSEKMRTRLAGTLLHWGGNPRNLDNAPAGVERGLFEAFRLPWPFSRSTAGPDARTSQETVRPRTTLEPGGPQGPTPPPLPPQPPPGLTDEMEQALEQWASGSLTQRHGNRLRQCVAASLSERIDWTGLRLRRVAIPPSWIWLPHVPVGNPTAEPKIAVGKDERPVPARIRRGLLGLDRWHQKGQTWNFDGAEDDYAAAQALLDPLQTQTEAWLLQSAQKELAVVSRTLHRQSLLLGIAHKAEPTDANPIELLASAGPAAVLPEWPTGPKSPTQHVVEALESARASRGTLQKLLLESCGCFQGSGQALHGLDRVRLLGAWKIKESDHDWRLVRGEVLAREAAQAWSQGATAASTLVTRYRAVVESAAPKVQQALGTAFEDRPSWIAQIQQFFTNATRAGVIPEGVSMTRVKEGVDCLGSKESEATLRRLLKPFEPKQERSIEVQLAIWAEFDVLLLARITQAVETLSAALEGISRLTETTLQATGGVDGAEALKKLQHELEQEGQP